MSDIRTEPQAPETVCYASCSSVQAFGFEAIEVI